MKLIIVLLFSLLSTLAFSMDDMTAGKLAAGGLYNYDISQIKEYVGKITSSLVKLNKLSPYSETQDASFENLKGRLRSISFEVENSNEIKVVQNADLIFERLDQIKADMHEIYE